MCGSRLRRLSSVTGDIELRFAIGTTQPVDVILSSLYATRGIDAFKQGAGLPDSTVVDVVSVEYAGGSTDNTASSSGGTIHALIDLSVNVGKFRRLLSQSETLSQAVIDSITSLVVLPIGSTVECAITESGQLYVANVSISVQSDLESSQASLLTFLVDDSGPSGSKTLPSVISAKSGVSVSYSQGYVPIVWTSPSDGSPLEQALNILPYVLAGVGVLVVIIATLGYKYRFVIRSTWDDLRWYRFGLSRDEGGWTGGRYAANFRSKSDASSIPDTATNFAEDEIDDIMLRYMDSIQETNAS